MIKQIVFFGSSPFSVVVLEKLLSAHCSVLSVVTTEDKPVGRHLKLTPNPVKALAQKYNILVFDNIKSFLEHDWPDCIGLVAAYGRIMGPKTLGKFDGQVFGIHPSLLPKYRGPSPLQRQILDGVSDTGVTIFKVDLGEDTGPIVATVHNNILENDTTITLGNRLFELGVNWFIENLLKIVNCKLKIQDESLATFTKKLTRQDGFIPWEKFNSMISNSDSQLEHLFRALYPWPGVWTINPEGKRIKIS